MTTGFRAEASDHEPAQRAVALQERFRATFGAQARVYHAPGRVNVIGEHTDYNDGFVMPVALALACRVAAALRDDGRLVVESINLGERAEIECTVPILPRGHWSDYVAGVARLLLEEGCAMAGATLLVESDVPIGAGLSSSAALEVAAATALLDLGGTTMDGVAVARLCQRAEHEFAGAAVGIMDPFVACHARRGTALSLDCRSLEYRHLPLPGHVRLLAANTMVRHAIAGGEYNRRRAECGEAVRRIGERLPGVRSLREVSMAGLASAASNLPDTLLRRARHVVSENDRVLEAAAALERGDLAALGPLMAASHRSLRDDYEVSCPELDVMVEIAARLPGVYGTRMTGGGFGGCTVTLVEAGAAAECARRLAAEYAARTGRQPETYVAETSDGARRLA